MRDIDEYLVSGDMRPIHISELCDAFGVPRRSLNALPSRAILGRNNSSSSWWTPVVTEFLTLLDLAVGGDRPGVFVWGATNYPDRVDPALTRPRRLDRVIHFAAPGRRIASRICPDLISDRHTVAAWVERSVGRLFKAKADMSTAGSKAAYPLRFNANTSWAASILAGLKIASGREVQ